MTTRRRTSVLALAAFALLAVTATACNRPPAGGTAPTPTAPGKIKVRYGPFTIPDKNTPGTGPFVGFMPMFGLQRENGMIWNQPVKDIKKPCENCVVTKMVAGMEYADGSNANIDSGVWLHHMVALSQGTGRSDATCAGNGFSLPHIAVGGSPANTERFFASGNERTVVEAGPGANAGYKINGGDRWHLIVDLMNETATAKQVYITMSYDYVPATTPGIRSLKPVWLDAAQCGTSEVPAKTGKYEVKSLPWTSTVAGPILGAGGHVHDGGTKVTIEKNGQVFCDSATKYGTKPEFISGADPGGGHDDGHGGGHGGQSHISEQSTCLGTASSPVTSLARGDRLTVTGHYDDAAHPQMVHDGKLHTVMAIAVLYVAQ